MLSKGLDLAGEAQSPQAPNVYYMSGLLYRAEGVYDMAHSEYEKAFGSMKKLNRLHNIASVNTLYLLSGSHKRRGEIDKAEELLNDALLSYQNRGEQHDSWEEKFYWACYWLFAVAAFTEDSSKKPQIRHDLDRAICTSLRMKHSTVELARYLNNALTGYTYLKEPELIDKYSCKLLIVWEKGTASRSQTSGTDGHVTLTAPTPLPSFIETICDALLS
jgi:tetratricopeptide (TPR) repeat protein